MNKVYENLYYQSSSLFKLLWLPLKKSSPKLYSISVSVYQKFEMNKYFGKLSLDIETGIINLRYLALILRLELGILGWQSQYWDRYWDQTFRRDPCDWDSAESLRSSLIRTLTRQIVYDYEEWSRWVFVKGLNL